MTKYMRHKYGFNGLFILLTTCLLVSCAKQEKTELKLLIEGIENERVFQLEKFLNAGLEYLLGTPSQRQKEISEIFKKESGLRRKGEELPESELEKLQLLINESKEDMQYVRDASDAFSKFSANHFAIISVSYSKCDEEIVSNAISKFYKNTSSKYFDIYNKSME